MDTPAERRIRASFPIIRFMQAYLPRSLMQWAVRQSMAHVRQSGDTKREAVAANGVPCEWITPPKSPADRVLLYLHGGGFVMGLTHLHLHMVAYMVKKMGMPALMVDYRLAPDHPFPAALDDCVTAYRWLLTQGIPAQNIVMAGDSAGGNLTLTSLMKLRDSGDPLPAAAACLSPVTDLTNRESLLKEFHDPLLPTRAMRYYNKAYVGRSDAHDPLISPVFGDMHKLPPLLVHAGEDEILHQDAVRIVNLAKSAGVDARLEIYPRMWHVWQLFLELPQAVQSLDDISQFLISHMKPNTS